MRAITQLRGGAKLMPIMNKFVQLVDVDGKDIWINPNQVCYIREAIGAPDADPDLFWIVMINGETHTISSTDDVEGVKELFDNT